MYLNAIILLSKLTPLKLNSMFSYKKKNCANFRSVIWIQYSWRRYARSVRGLSVQICSQFLFSIYMPTANLIYLLPRANDKSEL